MGENDFDYDEIQEKLNPTSVDEPDADSEELVKEDDDWSIIDPLDDEESTEEEPEEKPEVKEPEVKPEAVKKPEAPEADANDLKDALIKQNGEDFVLTVKGVERRLKDIPAKEIKAGLQKAFRSDQIFNELSAERKALDEYKTQERQREEQRIRQEAELGLLREQMNALRSGIRTPAPSRYGQPEEDAAYSPTDTPEVRQYKEELAKTQERLNSLESGIKQNTQVAFVAGVENEIRQLSKDYPMAPLDEVIAVKLARPDVKTEDLMKAAHDYYRGDQHIELALANNPEYMTKLEEKVVRDFIAKRQSARKIVGVPKGSSGSGKVESKGKITPIRDFKGANVAARAYIAEMERKGQD